jgi:putative solute:sodium symporter small subunit
MIEDRQRHWRRTLRLTVALLAVWFVASFGVTWFARDLTFDFLGWPFSFWFGAQGALLVYLGLVALYARRMRRLDREHGVDEDD